MVKHEEGLLRAMGDNGLNNEINFQFLFNSFEAQLTAENYETSFFNDRDDDGNCSLLVRTRAGIPNLLPYAPHSSLC